MPADSCLSPLSLAAPGGRRLRAQGAQGAAPRGPPPAAALPLQRSAAACCEQARGAGSEVTGCRALERDCWCTGACQGAAPCKLRGNACMPGTSCALETHSSVRFCGKHGRCRSNTPCGMRPRGGRRRQRGAAARTGLAMDRSSRRAAMCVICKSRAAGGLQRRQLEPELPALRPDTR